MKIKRKQVVNKSKFYVIRKIFRYAHSYIPFMIGIMILNLLSTPLILLNPVPLKIVVDNVFGEEPMPEIISKFLPNNFDFSFESILITAVLLIVIISILKNIQGLALWILQSYAGEKIVLSFRSKLFGHIQRMSLTYHDRVGISDSIYRIQYDAAAIRDMVLNAFSPLLTASLTIIGMIYVMFRLQWQLAIIAISIIPFLYFITKYS
ncbi:MAG: hypothetical protein KAQ62_10375, partial [Cyclobacteriaceae bacterium]|nr:hypothetical protein [Cyclobacteriaceae bacterium]